MSDHQQQQHQQDVLYDDSILDMDASGVDALLDSSLLAVEASFTEGGGGIFRGGGGGGYAYALGEGAALTDFVPTGVSFNTNSSYRGKSTSSRARGAAAAGGGGRGAHQGRVMTNNQSLHQQTAASAVAASVTQVGGNRASKSMTQHAGGASSMSSTGSIQGLPRDSIATLPSTVIDLGILVSSHAYPHSKPSQLTTMELARRWNEQPVSSEPQVTNGDMSNSSSSSSSSTSLNSNEAVSRWGIGGHIQSSSSSSSALYNSSFLSGNPAMTAAYPITFSPTSMNLLASQYARARAIATVTNAADPENAAAYNTHTDVDRRIAESTGVMKVTASTLKTLTSKEPHRSSPMRALRSSSAGGSEHLRIGGGLLNGGGIDEPVTVPYGSGTSSSSSSSNSVLPSRSLNDAATSSSSPGIVSEDSITNLAKNLIEDLVIKTSTSSLAVADASVALSSSTSSSSSSSSSSHSQPSWLNAVGPHLYPDVLNSLDKIVGQNAIASSTSSSSSSTVTQHESIPSGGGKNATQPLISEESERRILQALLNAVNGNIEKIDNLAFERVGGQSAFKTHSSSTLSSSSSSSSSASPSMASHEIAGSSTLSSGVSSTQKTSSSSSSSFIDPSSSPPPLPPRQAVDPSALISANAQLQTIATSRALDNYAKLSSHPLTSKKLRDVQLRFLTLLKDAQRKHTENEAAVEAALASGVISVSDYTARMRDLYQNATATSSSLQTAVRRKIEGLLAEASNAGLIQPTFASSPSVSPGGGGGVGSPSPTNFAAAARVGAGVNPNGNNYDIPMSVEEHSAALQQHVQSQQRSSPSQFSILRKREGGASAPNSGSPTRKPVVSSNPRTSTPTQTATVVEDNNTLQAGAGTGAGSTAPNFMTPPHPSTFSSSGSSSGGHFHTRSSLRRNEPSLITPGTTAAAAEIRLSRLVMERAPEALLQGSPKSRSRNVSPSKSSSPASPATAAAAAINAARGGGGLPWTGVHRYPPPASPISPPSRPLKESSVILGVKAKRVKTQEKEASI